MHPLLPRLSQKANTGPSRPLCHLILLPHLPYKELPQLVAPFLNCCHIEPYFMVTLLYKISIVYILKYTFSNCTFLVKVLAMPHPLCTYTLRVLYTWPRVCTLCIVPSN